MDKPPFTKVVVEASPLISCLKVDRFDLLEVFCCPLLCLNHVRIEISSFGQGIKLEGMVESGRIEEVHIERIEHVSEYVSLRAHRRSLGPGECASIVYAQANGVPLVITDRAATNEARKRGIQCMTTADVVVLNIRHGVLTVTQADALLKVWGSVNEGITIAKSFDELLK